MSIKITGIDALRRQINGINFLLNSREPMKRICEDVERRILKRTESGRDYRNMKFPSYSAKYAKRKGVGQSSVDLKLTGTMLGAIETKVINPHYGQVLVMAKAMPGTRAQSNMIAQIHTTGTGKQPKREFMNITDKALQDFVKEHYDDEIMRILGRI